MCSDLPVCVVVKWGLYVVLVYSQSYHTDWEGGDTEEILLDLLCLKYFWGKVFLEGAVYQSKGVVWVVCCFLGVCQIILM